MAEPQAVSSNCDRRVTEGFDSDIGQRILQLMRLEYLDMPGLSLDVPQAARLLNISASLSEHLLGRLRADGFLALTSTGRFVRA